MESWNLGILGDAEKGGIDTAPPFEGACKGLLCPEPKDRGQVPSTDRPVNAFETLTAKTADPGVRGVHRELPP